MRGISIVDSVLKCCRSPVHTETDQIRNVSPQLSFKSIAKLQKKYHSPKISLKDITIRRSDKDIKNQCSKTNHPTLGGCCSTIPENENVDNNIGFDTKSIKRVLSSPRTQVTFPTTNDTIKTSSHNLSSPRSFKKKSFDSSLKMISHSSSKSMKLKEDPAQEEKKADKFSVVKQDDEDQIVLENAGEECSLKKRSLQESDSKNHKSEELGHSLHTFISIQSNKSEQKEDLKMEESIIMVDYFNPTQSKIEKWGIEIQN